MSGRISLPPEEKMMEDIEAFYSKLDAAGVPKRYTHNIGDYQVKFSSISTFSLCMMRLAYISVGTSKQNEIIVRTSSDTEPYLCEVLHKLNVTKSRASIGTSCLTFDDLSEPLSKYVDTQLMSYHYDRY